MGAGSAYTTFTEQCATSGVKRQAERVYFLYLTMRQGGQEAVLLLCGAYCYAGNMHELVES